MVEEGAAEVKSVQLPHIENRARAPYKKDLLDSTISLRSKINGESRVLPARRFSFVDKFLPPRKHYEHLKYEKNVRIRAVQGRPSSILFIMMVLLLAQIPG